MIPTARATVDQTDLSGRTAEDALACFQTGVAYKLEGKLEKAIESLHNAISADSHFLEPYAELATIYSALEQPGKVGRILESFLELEDAEPQKIYRLAKHFHCLGKLEEAAGAYKKIIERGHRCADCYNELAAICLQSGQSERAESNLRACLELEHSHSGAHLNMGFHLALQGKGEEADEWYRLALEKGLNGCFPDFLIIGAQKCGTTSLYSALMRSRRISPARGYEAVLHSGTEGTFEKELHFFDLQFGRGIPWYLSQFPQKAQGRDAADLTGEASPYYIFHPLAPERVRAILPSAKIIVLLRNPVDRARSHYRLSVRQGVEPLSFEEACAREEERLRGETERLLALPGYTSLKHRYWSYLSRGRYAEQLESWLREFPRQQLLVLKSEDLFLDPEPSITRLSSFLGVDDLDAEDFPRLNQGPSPEAPDPFDARLVEYFRPHNDRLRELYPEITW